MRRLGTTPGLALLATAGLLLASLASSAAAQVTPGDTARKPPRDTSIVPIPQRPDSAIVGDTTRRDIVRADSMQAPLAQAESPVLGDVGLRFEWNREAFFSSGAVTLLDLLDRVPGLTGFRAGWVAAPMTAAYLGAPGRVRVFMDGVELDASLERDGGMLDLSAIQLWQLENVAVERGASEVRVYVRSWRQRRITPYTRVDVATGDEDTNAYRGFFGRRFHNGVALQLAAQQYSTSASARSGAAGDALSLLGRYGWARGSWSLDGVIQQTHRTHELIAEGTRDSEGRELLGAADRRDRFAYLRAGFGDSEKNGVWAQAIASLRRENEKGEKVDSAAAESALRVPGFAIDTTDSAATRAQYVGALGVTLGGFRASGTLRAREVGGTMRLSPVGRLMLDRRWASLSLMAEREDRGIEMLTPTGSIAPQVTRLEVGGRLSPLSFIAIAGAVTSETGAERPTDDLSDTTTAAALYARGEVGVRIGRAWLSAGTMQRPSAYLATPQLLYPGSLRAGTVPGVVSEAGPVKGDFVALRGTVWRGFGADAYGLRWRDADTYYRPRFQARSELYFRTNWLSRFPSGEFGFLVSGIHEYRSNVLFPSYDQAGAHRTAPQSHTVGTLVELRLQQAVISWQFRNITGSRYETVPGFAAPRPINFYGVRWEFWN